jgi:hypothetical protein
VLRRQSESKSFLRCRTFVPAAGFRAVRGRPARRAAQAYASVALHRRREI